MVLTEEEDTCLSGWVLAGGHDTCSDCRTCTPSSVASCDLALEEEQEQDVADGIARLHLGGGAGGRKASSDDDLTESECSDAADRMASSVRLRARSAQVGLSWAMAALDSNNMEQHLCQQILAVRRAKSAAALTERRIEELRQELCLRRAAAAHPPPEDLAQKGLRHWTTVEARRRRKEGLATEISHECVGLHIMVRAMGYLPGIGLGLAESGRLFPVSLPSQVKTHRGGVGYGRRDSPAMTEGFEVAAAAAEDSQSETALAAFGAAQPRFEVTVGADGRVVVSPVAALKKRPPQHRVNGSGDFAYPSPPPPTMTPPPSPSKYEVRVVEGRVTVTETPGTDGRHRFSEELEWRKESEGGDGAAKEKTAEAKKKGNLTRDWHVPYSLAELASMRSSYAGWRPAAVEELKEEGADDCGEVFFGDVFGGGGHVDACCDIGDLEYYAEMWDP